MSQMTKREIKRAFKRVLLKKPVNKITISDITDECEINRMTFYYHFKDIYELLEWSCLYDIGTVLEEKNPDDTWQSAFLRVFQAFYDNKDYVLKLDRSSTRGHIEKLLTDYTYSLIIDELDRQTYGMQVRDEDVQFLAEFFKYAFCGVLADWITGGMEKDPKKIIHQLSIVVEGLVKKALGKFNLEQSRLEP